jgi:pimeloyl-ACP methyl ester carboxylesterase
VRVAVLAALAALALPGLALAQPISIAKEGFFYVGGRKVTKANGSPAVVDSMFVEFRVPARKTKPFPIVLIHGGSTTGATWLGTPDGRDGWSQAFLRAGYEVYVVDQPTRGRSTYDAEFDGPAEKAPSDSTAKMFTAPAKYNLWPQAKLHTQYPGTGEPGDPAYDRFIASQHPALTDQLKTDEINQAAVAALLDRIGPAVLLTHSRSGPFGWLAADIRPKLVKAIVAVEPHGPPFKNNTEGATAGVGPTSVAERTYGVSYARLTFDPPLAIPADLKPVAVPPEKPDYIGCWKMGGAPRKLVNLVGKPVLILAGEASYHAQYDHCTAQFLTSVGVANDFVRLEDKGIKGNGHLMMVEKNNLEIARLIDRWLTSRLR